MSIKFEDMTYTSTVDGTGPMAMDVAWPAGGRNLPVVAVMAGYAGTREQVRPTVERLAGKGLLAVGINMRGRQGGPGAPDSGAVEIHDIVDALQTVCQRHPELADPNTWHIIGYSGGGGNVYSAVTKFPGRFVVAAAFFGVSDYALWYQTTPSDSCRRMEKGWIGGTPYQVPARYQARSALLAAGNAQWTELHLFWDIEENTCPEPMHSQFKSEADRQSNGRAKVILHQSRVGDPHRWRHGYPQDNPSLIAAEDLVVPRMLMSRGPVHLPLVGHLVVPGFVATEHFEYWIQDGRSAFGRIEYAVEKDGRVRIKDRF